MCLSEQLNKHVGVCSYTFYNIFTIWENDFQVWSNVVGPWTCVSAFVLTIFFISVFLLSWVFFGPPPGSLRITWQEIMVGVESGLLMFPINILIITIFRSIRPRVISKNAKVKSERNLRPFAVTVPSILKVCFPLWLHYSVIFVLFVHQACLHCRNLPWTAINRNL